MLLAATHALFATTCGLSGLVNFEPLKVRLRLRLLDRAATEL